MKILITFFEALSEYGEHNADSDRSEPYYRKPSLFPSCTRMNDRKAFELSSMDNKDRWLQQYIHDHGQRANRSFHHYTYQCQSIRDKSYRLIKGCAFSSLVVKKLIG